MDRSLGKRSREDSEKCPPRQYHEGESQQSDEASSSKKSRIDFATRQFQLPEQQQDQRKELDLFEAHGPEGVAPIISSDKRYYALLHQKHAIDNFGQQDQSYQIQNDMLQKDRYYEENIREFIKLIKKMEYMNKENIEFMVKYNKLEVMNAQK